MTGHVLDFSDSIFKIHPYRQGEHNIVLYAIEEFGAGPIPLTCRLLSGHRLPDSGSLIGDKLSIALN